MAEETLKLLIDSRGARQGAEAWRRSTGEVSRNAERAARGVAGLDDRVTRLRGSLSGVMGPMRSFIGAFVGIAAIRGAINTFATFDETMRTVQAVTRSSGEEFERLKDTAKELGATTRFSATQAGESLLFLGRAGFTAEQAIAAAPGTLDLAVAGVLDLGAAADYASNILAQFGLQATEMDRVADVLLNTSNRANTSVEQLAAAMKFAGTVAGSANISIEETSAAIGVLGDRGIQGAMAGTNLRQTILTLLKPTADAKKAIKELGIELEDLDPTTNSLVDIFQEFKDANLDLENATRIFSSRTASGAITLTESTDKLRELTQANEEAEGAARATAAAMDSGLRGSLLSLQSTIEATTIRLMESQGVVKETVDLITETIRVLLGMVDAEDEASKAAQRLAGAVVLAGAALGTLVAVKAVGFLWSLTAALGAAATGAAALNSQLVITAAILAGVLAFDFGGWLFREFKIVQELATMAAQGMDLVSQIVLREVQVLFARVKNIWNDTVDEMIRTALVMLRDNIIGAESMLSSVIGGVFGKAAREEFDAAVKLIHLVGTDQNIQAERRQKQAERNLKTEEEIAAIRKQSAEEIAVLMDAYEADLAAIEEKFQGRDRMTGDSWIDQLGETVKNIGNILQGRDIDLSGPVKEAAKELQESADNLKVALAAFNDESGDGEEGGREVDPLAHFFDEIKREKELVGLTNDERERAIRLREMEAVAMEAGRDDVEELVEAYRKELIELQNLYELRETADEIGTAFSDAFEAILKDGEGLKFGLEMLFRDIIDSLYEQFVSKQIQQFVSNLIMSIGGGGSVFGGGQGPAGTHTTTPGPNLSGTRFAADGAVLAQGNIVPFADGGIVGSPTFFPMAGGRTGVMGEAGEEGIFPLARTKDGKLGVRGEGGRSNVTVNFNVHAKDHDSFRYAEFQTMGKLLDMTRKMGI